MDKSCCDHDPHAFCGSYAHWYGTPGCDKSSGAKPSCGALLLLPPRMLTAAACGAVRALKETLDSPSGHCGQCGGYHAHGSACCGIPETDCPDRCACHIHWVGCAGDTFHYQLQISNVSKKQHEFTLKAKAFPCTDKRVQVAPVQKTLAPGESFQAEVSFTIPDDFSGGLYHGEIILTGAYEQCIGIHLGVKPRQAGCCHIEPDDVGKRNKAHHWSHHFQRTRDSFPTPL